MVKVIGHRASAASFGAIERTGSVGICNPRHDSKILADDANRGVTPFMPLAVAVHEDKQGQVFVSQLNVGLLGTMFGGVVAQVMAMAGKDLKEVVASATAR
jgi:uncharacterized protein (DUF302 family)